MNACTELIIWGELTKKLSIRVNGYSFSQGGRCNAIFLAKCAKIKGLWSGFPPCAVALSEVEGLCADKEVLRVIKVGVLILAAKTIKYNSLNTNHPYTLIPKQPQSNMLWGCYQLWLKDIKHFVARQYALQQHCIRGAYLLLY